MEGMIKQLIPGWLKETATQLIGKKCSVELLDRFNYGNIFCLKLAASKALGVGIIGGSMIVKVPQIIKMWASKSANGVSLPSYLLELLARSITLMYNWRAGNPLTTYGEYFAMIAQNLIILAMMGAYRRQGRMLSLIMLVYAVCMASLIMPGIVCNASMRWMQAMTLKPAA